MHAKQRYVMQDALTKEKEPVSTVKIKTQKKKDSENPVSSFLSGNVLLCIHTDSVKEGNSHKQKMHFLKMEIHLIFKSRLACFYLNRDFLGIL